MVFVGHLKGRTGRLVRGYDVLTEFHGWEAIGNWDGTVDAVDRRPGAMLNVDAHQPDELTWPLRTNGELSVELDMGNREFHGPARILIEAPLLTIEITGELESH